ncbi:hypothetical protein J3T78_02280 [Staphylococcus nepalensis]|uniref:Uncharacterized protein n=2 Tax=Staphylococcus nepalensis TaxID=214473 RepID=A0ABS3L3W3_9STAP|nr:hypothetical protein [Staphylococcus nepalensis]MBO1217434.1 hypothetical protein [Staphylococcus nepalensis]MBO1228244.1 hypothetical protein [Staphylococcus nepalensis]MBO1233776.1 hypothetical protein [Staphylococcus nepalensis]MBO1236534.1 hypothetical protein [Staphylococcus nepalensis]
MIASTLLFGTGLFTFWRGLFWTIEQDSVLGDSAFYQELHQLMPIWIWGILFMLAGLSLVCASYLLPKKNQKSYWFITIGSFISFIMYFIITSASVYNALNWLSPIQLATLSGIYLVMTFFGGFEIYGRRR